MATAAGVPGADLIPDTLGALPRLHVDAANGARAAADRQLRDARLVDLGPRSYFHGGTHMHLSHIFEDLEAWYLNFDFRERVDTAFRPRLPVRPGRRPFRSPAAASRSENEVRRDYRPLRSDRPTRRDPAGLAARAGHPSARTGPSTEGDGGPAPRRLQHARQPVLLERGPEARPDGRRTPAAGLHFVVFNPTSDDFHRNRLAMDGVMPDGDEAAVRPRRPRPGLQLDPADDAPAELPRPAAAPPLVPARRALGRPRAKRGG